MERCSLRSGNVHSADDWESVLKPVVVRYKDRKVRLYFWGDAAFASPEIYQYLEAEGFLYAIRLPKNQVLQESIGHRRYETCFQRSSNFALTMSPLGLMHPAKCH